MSKQGSYRIVPVFNPSFGWLGYQLRRDRWWGSEFIASAWIAHQDTDELVLAKLRAVITHLGGVEVTPTIQAEARKR